MRHLTAKEYNDEIIRDAPVIVEGPIIRDSLYVQAQDGDEKYMRLICLVRVEKVLRGDPALLGKTIEIDPNYDPNGMHEGPVSPSKGSLCIFFLSDAKVVSHYDTRQKEIYQSFELYFQGSYRSIIHIDRDMYPPFALFGLAYKGFKTKEVLYALIRKKPENHLNNFGESVTHKDFLKYRRTVISNLFALNNDFLYQLGSHQKLFEQFL